MKIIKSILIFPNQLFNYKQINDYTNIIIWEHDYFYKKYNFHKMKLVFHTASCKKYYDDIPSHVKKMYIKSIEKNHMGIIKKFISENKIKKITLYDPIESELRNLIKSNSILDFPIEYDIIKSPYFLNSFNQNINNKIIKNIKFINHSTFYKFQRVKYSILVDDDNKPIGGKWSYDVKNRNRFDKETKDNISPNKNSYVYDSIKYVTKYFKNNNGECNEDDFIYPIDRKNALIFLRQFIKNKLENFGKFQDAISSKIKYGYHSILSPLLNTGLLTPFDVLKNIKKLVNDEMSSELLYSIEGFIRQLIGWREYCYFIYDNFRDNIVLKKNIFYDTNHRKISTKIWQGKTLLPFIDNIIMNVNKTAYSHHIERLMCIGNFFVLIGIHPTEIYNWFQSMYIDSYDVFMIPNVYGMLLYNDINNSKEKKTQMMKRPYFCSSNYIIKMSDYKDSEIMINKKKYKWCYVLDSLFYNHINNYSDKLIHIYSHASSVKRWNNFPNTKKKDIINTANEYIKYIFN